MTDPTPRAEPNMIAHVFVYGTLKRGQCRAGLWPAKPISITPAWTLGTLYGRHDYPAMRPGADRVLGELWNFEETDVQSVMQALDQIEGTNQPSSDDLYVRAVVEVFDVTGNSIANAFAYHYATDPLLDGFQKIDPSEYAQWP